MCDDVNANKSLNGNERETPSIRSRLTHGFKILRRHGGWPGLRREPGSRRGSASVAACVCRRDRTGRGARWTETMRSGPAGRPQGRGGDSGHVIIPGDPSRKCEANRGTALAATGVQPTQTRP